MRRANSREKIDRNVANALADVPIDNKRERNRIHARLRRKYADLEPAMAALKAKDRRRFEDLGKLMDMLEACENRPPGERS
jgi:hypothetical protein